MSKSKSPSATRQTTTTSTIPEYARPFYEEMMGRGVAESLRPLEQTIYPGARLADFDPYERAGMQGMYEMAAAGAPQQTGMASDIASQIGYKPTNLGMSIAGGYDPGTLANQQAIQQYMNPFQQLVTDVEKREARRQSDIDLSQIGQQAAQAGGLGGYREGIMQAERQRNLGQQLGDIQTRGGQAAYQQAQQAFEQDRAAQRGAAELALSGASQDLSAQSQTMESARLLGQLGAQEQQMAYGRLQPLQAAGQIRREMEQKGLDVGYQDFLRQLGYSRDQLAYFNAVLQGLPVTPATTQTEYGGASPAQQLIGAGISGVGLYNAFNQPRR